MRSIIFIFLILINFGIYSFFGFDSYKAHELYQKCDYQGAQQIYEKNLIKMPRDLNLNFNLGDVLYRQEKYDQALPYFSRVIDGQKVDDEFKEQAYFNRGNTYVKLSKFEEAIKDYESAIEINPLNERAKHNLELAKKLLKQKQQQQENQQQKGQDQGKQQDRQKNQDKDQKNEDKSQSDKKKEEPSEQPNDDKKDNGAQNNKEENGNDKKSEKQKDDKQNDQSQQRDNHNLNKNVNQNEKNNEEKSNYNQDTQKSQIDKQPKEEEESSAGAGKSNQGEKNNAQDVSQEDKNGESPQKNAIAKFLQFLDERDKKNNKQLTKMKINKGMQENNGQKNW